ncbi:MAG: DUF2007 domain-containing protein [Bacteroidota bacterium]
MKEQERIVIYRRFYNYNEATIVKSRLESEGIPCFLSDEHINTLNPLYNQAMGGFKLNLFEKDISRADEILKKNTSLKENDIHSEYTQGDIQCPLCGSYNASWGQSSKRPYGFLTILISFLLFTYPFAGRYNYHCFNCGHEWEKVSRKE